MKNDKQNTTEQYVIRNAIITSVSLDIKMNGVLSGWLNLDYGVECQGFVGWSLYLPKSFKHHTMLSHAGHWIYRVMEIAGVESWDELKGKTIRVDACHKNIRAIGHIVKDDWFNPNEDFEMLNQDK